MLHDSVAADIAIVHAFGDGRGALGALVLEFLSAAITDERTDHNEIGDSRRSENLE
jgi:hypothetical protein